ncbi:hypothetical protein BGZ47_004209, partial [Haplosporangium gracile]
MTNSQRTYHDPNEQQLRPRTIDQPQGAHRPSLSTLPIPLNRPVDTSSAIPTPRKRIREEITEDYTNQLKRINTTEEDNFNTIFKLPNGDERMAEIRKRN